MGKTRTSTALQALRQKYGGCLAAGIALFEMPSLLRKLNYRNIILDENTQNETVAVRLKSNELRQIIWLGMIERQEAIAKQKTGSRAASKAQGTFLSCGQFWRIGYTEG